MTVTRAINPRGIREVVAPFARAGYAARGLIYAIIGCFAVLAAFGSGQKKDTHGALQTLMQNAGGSVLAWVLMIGLLSYALWRLAQALIDTDNHGTDAKGLAIRSGLLVSAGSYAALLVYTYALWNGSRSSSGSHGQLASALAGFVGTRTISWLLAVVFFAVGIALVVKALKEGYARYFQASRAVMKIVHPIAKTGLIARGAVFWVIALLFVYRGFSVSGSGGNPGLHAALNFIQSLPGGFLLLGATGAGLVAFSVYSFAEAIWRRIHI